MPKYLDPFRQFFEILSNKFNQFKRTRKFYCFQILTNVNETWISVTKMQHASTWTAIILVIVTMGGKETVLNVLVS